MWVVAEVTRDGLEGSAKLQGLGMTKALIATGIRQHNRLVTLCCDSSTMEESAGDGGAPGICTNKERGNGRGQAK